MADFVNLVKLKNSLRAILGSLAKLMCNKNGPMNADPCPLKIAKKK